MFKQEYLPTQFFLKPGYAMANQEASIIRAVLGNCVAVTFFDRSNRFGGMNQFVFPETTRREDMTAQYGNVGIRALLRMLLDMGATRSEIVAQIIGGSACRVFDDGGLGSQNITLARTILEKLKVPVVSEDVGGAMGRKVISIREPTRWPCSRWIPCDEATGSSPAWICVTIALMKDEERHVSATSA